MVVAAGGGAGLSRPECGHGFDAAASRAGVLLVSGKLQGQLARASGWLLARVSVTKHAIWCVSQKSGFQSITDVTNKRRRKA